MYVCTCTLSCSCLLSDSSSSSHSTTQQSLRLSTHQSHHMLHWKRKSTTVQLSLLPLLTSVLVRSVHSLTCATSMLSCWLWTMDEKCSKLPRPRSLAIKHLRFILTHSLTYSLARSLIHSFTHSGSQLTNTGLQLQDSQLEEQEE